MVWKTFTEFCCMCFFVIGFFEAVKQNHSRRMGVPVEDISIQFDDQTHFKKEKGVSVIICYRIETSFLSKVSSVG